MRISTAWRYEQGVAQMMRQQEKIATTQNQRSSNQKWKTAADDPAGWAQAQSYDQRVAQTRQYTSNAQAEPQRPQMRADPTTTDPGPPPPVPNQETKRHHGPQAAA